MSDIQEARRVLEVEANCILAAREKLDENFTKSVKWIVENVKNGGKVVVSAVGKSGKVGAKVAATLSSVGVPSLFMHATEGAHGDLGIVSPKDIFLAISNSGNSEEILRLLPSLRKLGVKIVSIVGNVKSKLATESDAIIDASVTQEACPLNLAPTSSTTVALSLGDALAVVLSGHFQLNEEEFSLKHPAGSLGRRLTLRVSDLMTKATELPWIDPLATMETVVEIVTAKKLGAAVVRQKAGSDLLLGIITDGDIRRALKHRSKFFNLTAKEIMTKGPVTIGPKEKAIRALELMENRPSQINVLPVVDEQGACVGLVRLHDLIGSL